MEKFGFRAGQVADLRRIRLRLRRGQISQIAREMKISPRKVSEVFEYGWHDEKVAVVARALELIKGGIDGQKQLTSMAKTLDLTTSNLQSIPYQRKKPVGLPVKRRKKRLPVGLIVAGVGVAAVLFVVAGGMKLLANLIGKGESGALTTR